MSTGPRSATVIDTSDVVVETRPTAKIKIGSGTYVVTAPKMDVWRDTTKLLAFADRSQELRAADNLSEEELAELETVKVVVGELDRMVSAIITGQNGIDEDGEMVLRGGFLRRCLSHEDWQKVKQEWNDHNSGVDADYLLRIARKIQEQFSPWFEERGAALGLPEVDVPAPAKRKTPAKSKTAG
jgi:hypothetical protein